MVACGALLSNFHPDLAGSTIRLPYRLLRFRLDDRPTLDGDLDDAILRETLHRNVTIASPRADISAALGSIRMELGDAGAGIRVC
jgi:hypothetical protein